MRPLSKAFLLLTTFAVTALTAACTPDGPSGDRGASDADGAAKGTVVGVIDSTLAIDTLLRRFRATLPDTPRVLAGNTTTPERLVRTLLTALAVNDTAAIRALVITPSEFAWLFFPHTKWMRSPYEMGPELVWLQLGAGSEKGLVRLLRRYGGTPLRFESLRCPDSAIRTGPVAVTEGCLVRFAAGDSAARELHLFGSLLHRDGTYKFVSYSNDL